MSDTSYVSNRRLQQYHNEAVEPIKEAVTQQSINFSTFMSLEEGISDPNSHSKVLKKNDVIYANIFIRNAKTLQNHNYQHVGVISQAYLPACDEISVPLYEAMISKPIGCAILSATGQVVIRNYSGADCDPCSYLFYLIYPI